ncbi:hypothetical protein CK217_30415 [Mesorhizobium loti]|nr:hypothetical protein CK217_30415 [Mesorhizobium loti]PBB83433.1 hypothetical protein CK216_28955 [Mesorhizobium sp. WSM3876]
MAPNPGNGKRKLFQCAFQSTPGDYAGNELGLADNVEFAEFFQKAIFRKAAYIELLRRFIQG